MICLALANRQMLEIRIASKDHMAWRLLQLVPQAHDFADQPQAALDAMSAR